MGENEFWLRIWKTVAAVVVVAVLMAGSCTMHENSLKMKFVEQGYQQVTVHGTGGLAWQKVQEDK